MKLPVRVSFLFFISIFLVGSTALGYYYYFVYAPPLRAAEAFMEAMTAGSAEALAQTIIVTTGVEEGELRNASPRELKELLAESFQRGRILDQRKREGANQDYYYLVYREPDGRIFALVVTEVEGSFRVVIPEAPMSKRRRYLWDYTWTN
ncbi:MAG: hypothetical protein HY646_18310 [Acidobacteria bacterium]|nr:hypothetical protein [Acidobacteriota bacterium]